MRPRSEVVLALGLLGVLVAGAALLGRRPRADTDQRPSTFLAGPGGARALLDALIRLEVPVRRFRQRTRELATLPPSDDPLLVVLGPTVPFSSPERSALLAHAAQSHLLLAGKSAESLVRCFGYLINRRLVDSVRVREPGRPPRPGAPWVRATLAPTRQTVVVDSSRMADVERVSCVVPSLRAVDTLLLAEDGRPVALRLHLVERRHEVVLLADEGLLRNRQLRKTDAGPFGLGLLAGRYDRVVFEEYHHGFGASGSLAARALAWSRGSPWGWLAWQLAGVGLLALLFGAIRFGAPRPGISRTRRSPLEHLRALSTALAAARGHDVAIAAIVRGLRRRLVPPALRARGDWRTWLAQLGREGISPRAREALATLDRLTRPGQPLGSVLLAANAVEDLWEELRP
jgi:hypothetical protein